MENIFQLSIDLYDIKHSKVVWSDRWEEKYNKEHKLRQEAEGELTIVKTITIDSSPEMRAAKKEIQRSSFYSILQLQPVFRNNSD